MVCIFKASSGWFIVSQSFTVAVCAENWSCSPRWKNWLERSETRTRSWRTTSTRWRPWRGRRGNGTRRTWRYGPFKQPQLPNALSICTVCKKLPRLQNSHSFWKRQGWWHECLHVCCYSGGCALTSGVRVLVGQGNPCIVEVVPRQQWLWVSNLGPSRDIHLSWTACQSPCVTVISSALWQLLEWCWFIVFFQNQHSHC